MSVRFERRGRRLPLRAPVHMHRRREKVGWQVILYAFEALYVYTRLQALPYKAGEGERLRVLP